MGGLDNLSETILYYLTLMSLYFHNNLKDIKLQNLFPINGNSFQRKPKLIATPYILQYRFVFETVFILEQTAENRFGALL